MDSPHTQKAYGLAFAIKTNIHIKNTECISDRIVAITVDLHDIHHTSKDSDRHRPSTMTIINVYAPHSIITTQNRAETDRFYDQLQLTYNSYKNNSAIVLIAGDFNARVGTKLNDDELHLGSFTKKHSARNANGYLLSDFALSNEFLLTNTCFNHRSCHISTFTGRFRDSIYYNQIDYILCPLYLRALITDSRAQTRTKYISDHKILITSLNLRDFYLRSRNQILKRPLSSPLLKFDCRALATDIEVREAYNTEVERVLNLLPNMTDQTSSQRWDHCTEAIKQAATTTLPSTEPTSHFPDFTLDPRYKKIADRIRFFNTKLYHIRANAPAAPPWTYHRRCKRHYIRALHKRRSILLNNYLNHLATTIEKRSAQFFKLARQLQQKP